MDGIVIAPNTVSAEFCLLFCCLWPNRSFAQTELVYIGFTTLVRFVNFGRFLVVTSEFRFLAQARTASLWSFHRNEELVFSDDIISASKPI